MLAFAAVVYPEMPYVSSLLPVGFIFEFSEYVKVRGLLEPEKALLVSSVTRDIALLPSAST